MTTPSAGYPDWQTGVQARTVVQSGFSAALPPGGFSVNTFPANNYPTLRLYAGVNALKCSVTVEFTSTSNGQTISAARTLTLNPASFLDMMMPIVGDSVNVSFSNIGVSNASLNYAVEVLNLPITRDTNTMGGTFFSSGGLTVPASGIVDTVLPTQVGGLHQISVSPTSANPNLEVAVEALDINGSNTEEVYTALLTGVGFNPQVVLPWAPCRIRLINNSTTAAFTGSVNDVARGW